MRNGRITSFVLVFILAILMGCVSDTTPNTPPLSNKTTTVVCIGDSITRGDSTTPTYPESLARLTGFTTINKGVNGETTDNIYARFMSDVINQSPDYVVILGGQNDISLNVPPSRIKINIQSMVVEARAYNITPVLCTIMPSDKHNSTQNAIRSELNTWISEYGKTNNITVVDLFKTFGAPENEYKFDPDYTSDGTHPTAAGNVLMAATIHKAVWEKTECA